jgi:hypothetical protein
LRSILRIVGVAEQVQKGADQFVTNLIEHGDKNVVSVHFAIHIARRFSVRFFGWLSRRTISGPANRCLRSVSVWGRGGIRARERPHDRWRAGFGHNLLPITTRAGPKPIAEMPRDEDRARHYAMVSATGLHRQAETKPMRMDGQCLEAAETGKPSHFVRLCHDLSKMKGQLPNSHANFKIAA